MEEKFTCKYCGSEMKKVAMPFDAKQGSEYVFICFNDDCSYYVRGWEWMAKQYQQKCSYRYRINSVTGQTGPIPVISPDTYRESIVE